MKRFFRVVLRTLDVEAANRFYGSVLGAAPPGTVPLHEQAIARGARPHWLGFIDVGDVDRASACFVSRGATVRGPKWVNPEGLEAAVMHDPSGAIVALAKPPATVSPPAPGERVPDVVLCSHHSADVARAIADYVDLLGPDSGELSDLGVFIDIAGRPEVHPHWLFHFDVPALDDAIARVRAGGGLVLEPITLPSGARIAVCDDPQGAAFALHQS